MKLNHRRTPTDIWLRQDESSVDIQFCETDAPVVGGDKHNSHIFFLSKAPEKDLQRLAEWFQKHGHEAKIGAWSAREFWLDLPAIFVDFTTNQ